MKQNSLLSASSPGFPKAKWGLGNSRARDTSEKRERGVMGTSVERERGVMGRKRRLTQMSLSDCERLGTRQVLCYKNLGASTLGETSLAWFPVSVKS